MYSQMKASKTNRASCYPPVIGKKLVEDNECRSKRKDNEIVTNQPNQQSAKAAKIAALCKSPRSTTTTKRNSSWQSNPKSHQ